MRIRPAGLSDSSDSEGENYHDALITVDIGGQTVMLSKKTTYYLLQYDEATFSQCLCCDAWNKDIALHTKLNGSHRANELIHSLQQLGIHQFNYLNQLKIFLACTPHWTSTWVSRIFPFILLPSKHIFVPCLLLIFYCVYIVCVLVCIDVLYFHFSFRLSCFPQLTFTIFLAPMLLPLDMYQTYE